MIDIWINGFNDTSNKERPSDQDVQYCKNILSYITEKKGFSSGNSYIFKHCIEKFSPHKYIPNGAFIKAALEMGMSFKKETNNSPNALFKFNKMDVRIALSKYLIEDHIINIDNNKVAFINNAASNCLKHSPNTSIKTISEILNISIIDLLKILDKNKNIKIKYIFNSDKTISDVNDFLNLFTINVSITQLNNYILKNEVLR